MYYKYYSSPNVSRSMQSTFLGLNKNARIGDGEFADMQNMSSDNVPLLSPRQPRTVVEKRHFETSEDGEVTYKNLNGILGDVGFAAVWGNDLYYMGSKVEGITLIDGEKRMLAMGANIIIYPDAVYYNTVSGEYGEIDQVTACAKAEYVMFDDITFNISKSGSLSANIAYASTNGNTYSITRVSVLGSTASQGEYDYTANPNIREDNPASFSISSGMSANASPYTAVFGTCDGYLYYCKTADVQENKTASGDYTYRYTNAVWEKVNIEYAQLSEENFTALGFTAEQIGSIWVGDTLLEIEHGDGYYRILNENIAEIFRFYRNVKNNNAYKAVGLSAGQWKHKTLPALDYVCVHENRLWGCHYGSMANLGDSANEIYCSALGDFKTWTLSSETSTLPGDPYTASVGEYGKFTGCISYRGYVLFFKDDVIYRVSGNKPSNFQIEKISETGLQSGCEKSMEIIDEVLYYKSRSGVYAYDGSLPQKISDALGSIYYTDAVAGHLLGKYYISMVSDGVRKLYVYDTRNGLWHAEDSANAEFFTEYEGALYAGVDNDIVCLSGSPAKIFGDTEREGDVCWYAETGDIGLGSPYQKYFRRILIRMDMDVGARVTVELQCDSGDWQTAMDFTAANKRSVQMPIVTPRCDHMRMRISGVGNAKIYSVSYETETVGERPMRT